MDLKLAELPKHIATMQQETMSCCKELIASQQFLSGKFDDMINAMMILKDEVKQLRTENDRLKMSIKSLSQNNQSITDGVYRAEVDFDSHLRAQLATNSIVLGIPRSPQEDTSVIVHKLCDSLDCPEVKNEIVASKRIVGRQSENSPIKVSFRSIWAKERFMQRKKGFGTMDTSMIKGFSGPKGKPANVMIRDELSPLSMRLLHELRSLQDKLELRFVWPGRNGAIMIRKNEHSKAIPIQSRQDILKLQSSGLKQ